MESNRRIMSNEEITAFRQKEHQELVRVYAYGLLSTMAGYNCPFNFSNLFSYMSDNKNRNIDVKNEIITLIQNSDKTADHKYAAIAFYNLRERIYWEDDMQKHYHYIVDAMRDDKITLPCMNAMFEHFSEHMYGYLQRVPDHKKVQKLLFPTDHSPDWLNMIEKLQEVAEEKLTHDVKALENPADKLALLDKAEKMKIFTTANHDHAISSLFSRKSSITTIERMKSAFALRATA